MQGPHTDSMQLSLSSFICLGNPGNFGFFLIFLGFPHTDKISVVFLIRDPLILGELYLNQEPSNF
jgi:hypothetical protein